MPSHSKVALLAAMLALAGMIVSGCTSQQAEREPDWDELYRVNVATLSAQFQLEHGLPPPGNVEFVRFIDPSEYGRVHAECVNEQGFRASETFDGGVHFGEVPPDQALAFAEAIYRCEVAYPVHPRHFATTSTEEDLRRIYDYRVDELMPCLIAEGYQVDPPPTWAVFRDASPEARWHPYHFVDPHSETEWQRINETCPQSLSMVEFFRTRQ